LAPVFDIGRETGLKAFAAVLADFGVSAEASELTITGLVTDDECDRLVPGLRGSGPLETPAGVIRRGERGEPGSWHR
jgi:hypothetical protein